MLWCSQCWHSAGNGLEDTVFFVMKWWRNLQCEWFRHYRICSCQETRNESFIIRNESFIVDTVREPEYLPIPRCRIARLSRTCGHVGMSLSCLSDVIIAFGSLGFFMRLMIACEMLAKDWLGFSCYCLQCPHMWMNKTAPGHARLVQYGVGWWLLACESDAWIASMYQTWWLPFRVFRVEVLRFTVACLFPVNTYPVWKRLLNTTMNDAWEHGCECEYIPHIMIPPASSRERMVYAVSTENIFHAYGKG